MSVICIYRGCTQTLLAKLVLCVCATVSVSVNTLCPGWYGRSGGMAQKLLEEELRRKADKKAQSLRAASELELERRNILNAMRYREPERGVVHSLDRSSTAPDRSCLINAGLSQPTSSADQSRLA